ncbi:flagellar hook assembly protein FlgD [Microvirga tunisiensis]|uniref:Basal-body rod modification protein FlgD n=2 Tax=Pannonibacter tanglangensis TaxID=2750084 RepID=A0A7X5EZ92_9HYPH|nr:MULTISPECIES: flagellar hook capping FlgD N-terminal domain-containing protein [unclassified Pannonibacter]NBN63212.1 flagellar hook assembly protein FlgD [Pannonibacter sp. XCT-34]NBN76850.1 flagellar hook assembly protein FlgD [Pannonibacter sp. XCT-53]
MATVSTPTAAGTSQTSSTDQSRKTLFGSYDLFLKLLTTQIKNQNPLEPLDPAQYTQQLVQYSTVEQGLKTNEQLASLLSVIQSGQASSYVSYLGSYVSAAGDSTMLENGKAVWNYSVAEDAKGFVEVRNSGGALVYRGEVNLSKGNGSYTWDGKTSEGATAAAGAYTIKFDVYDTGGAREAVTSEVKGKVDKVDMSSGTAFLKIGDVRIPVSAVKTVSSTAI